MTLGERKAAANKRRRAFHIYAMSTAATLSAGVFAALAFVGLIGPAQWATSRQETVLGKVFTGWLTGLSPHSNTITHPRIDPWTGCSQPPAWMERPR